MKNSAGFSVNTGLAGSYDFGPDDFPRVPAPQVSVRNVSGKEVASLQQTSAYANFRAVLPPGTYRLVIFRPNPQDLAALPAEEVATLTSYYKAYRCNAPETVKIEAGHTATPAAGRKPSASGTWIWQAMSGCQVLTGALFDMSQAPHDESCIREGQATCSTSCARCHAASVTAGERLQHLPAPGEPGERTS